MSFLLKTWMQNYTTGIQIHTNTTSHVLCTTISYIYLYEKTYKSSSRENQLSSTKEIWIKMSSFESESVLSQRSISWSIISMIHNHIFTFANLGANDTTMAAGIDNTAATRMARLASAAAPRPMALPTRVSAQIDKAGKKVKRQP